MQRRAPVIIGAPNDELVEVAGTTEQPPPSFEQYHCSWSMDWRRTVARSDVDAILVCTPPYNHAEITIAALDSGKHVLCEKPLSRSLGEAEAMVAAADRTRRILKCGFNLRHHPAILEAKRRLDQGELGRPIVALCRHGICGRPGYESEWRADPDRAIGGHYAEQGMHAIDLFRWFIGDLAEVSCMTATGYFKTQPLDDNGMALFRAQSGALATLHTSLTQWKNLFSLEVTGEDGYVVIEGLGGSYGTEHLSVGRRDFSAPFQDHVIQYRGGDTSWKAEWQEFTDAVIQGREPLGSGRDGLEAVRIGLASYHAERTRTVVDIARFGSA